MDESNKSEELRKRAQRFTIRVLKLYRALPKAVDAQIVGKQLVRSGSSVAANYRAACRARSKAEFVAKIGVVAEEADESVFWIETLIEGDIMPARKMESLLKETRELTAIFTASQHTAKGRK